MGLSLERIAKKSQAPQGKQELAWLLGKVADVDPKVVVEIGVHDGHLLKLWQDAFMPEILIGIDNSSTPTLEEYLNTGVVQASLARFDSHDPGCVKMIEFLLGGRKIDVLFIDGDHSYNGVEQDFNMYKHLVKKGGIIAFNRVATRIDEYQVDAFWQSIKKKSSEVCHIDGEGIGVYYV